MTAPTTETLAGLLAEATPGPWEASPHAWPEQIGCCPLVGRPFSISPAASAYNVAAATTQSNARLIALAPTLAAEVIALRERVAALEGALSDMIAVAEQDSWDKSMSGRQIIIRNSRAILNPTEGVE